MPAPNQRARRVLSPSTRSCRRVALRLLAAVILAGCGATQPEKPPAPVPGADSHPSPRASSTPSPGSAALYVSLDGDDSATGAKGDPYRTIAKAVALARPGDVVYVRRGVYAREQVEIRGSGTAAQPIVIRPYRDERVVLDGQADTTAGGNLWFDWEGLVEISGSHLVFEGFEIRNSPGLGIHVAQATGVRLRHNHIHDVWRNAIQMSGEDLVAERNEITRASMNNYRGRSPELWSGGIATNLVAGGGRSTNVRWLDNHIHHVWGECVAALHIDGYRIAGNDVHDCWSANVYLDNTRNGVVERNFSHRTDSTMDARPGHALAWANEPYSNATDLSPTENVVIRNNVFAHSRSITYVKEGRANDYYRNISFVGNTLYRQALEVGEAPGGTPTGNLAANNIFGGPVQIAQPGAWRFERNVTGAGGVSAGSARFFEDPQAGSAVGFKPRSPEGLEGRGVPLEELETDIAGRERPARPTIGAWEIAGDLPGD